MNRLSPSKQVQILNLLVEGNSLRSTSRLVDCSINTVTKLLVDVGKASAEYQNKVLRNLPCKRIEVDEIWSFCYAKQKNVRHIKKKRPNVGDIWTYTSICADTKLVPCWLVGPRNREMTTMFIDDLATRFKNRIQLSSDGYKPYVDAVDLAFGNEVDYAMIVKIFEDNNKYRAENLAIDTMIVSGEPDKKYISTSYVERQNLTMRSCIRRFTRETNAFSKKVENHAFAVALHFMYYNFCRVHSSLRVTPAMEAGIAHHIWNLEELIELK